MLDDVRPTTDTIQGVLKKSHLKKSLSCVIVPIGIELNCTWKANIFTTSYRSNYLTRRSKEVKQFHNFTTNTRCSVVSWTILFYGVMHSGVECVCGVTLSVYPHRASSKICLTTKGIELVTFGLLVQIALPTELRGQVRFECVKFRNSRWLSSEISHTGTDLTSYIPWRWIYSIPCLFILFYVFSSQFTESWWKMFGEIWRWNLV